MLRNVFVWFICAVMLSSYSINSATHESGSNSKAEATPENYQSSTNAAEMKAADFFPLDKDVHMKYKGTGNEYAAYETYVDYAYEDSIQVRNVSGTVSAIVYRIKDGTVRKVFSKEETYYRYDYTAFSDRDEIIIKDPIRVGNSWTLADGSVRSITAVDRQVKTPTGEYTALEVTTQNQDSVVKAYYAAGTGLVKSEFTSENGSFKVISELEKIERGVPFKQTVKFYFPEFNKNRIVFINRDVDIFSNEDIKYKFEQELKTIPQNSGLSKVLSANAGVLGCKLDENTVTVDLSSDFVNGMNAGIMLESMLLRCVTNTFGEYYQKSRVIITIEGKPYESGHVIMKQGEYFTVDTDGVVQYE